MPNQYFEPESIKRLKIIMHISELHEYGEIPEKEQSLAKEFLSKERKKGIRDEIEQIFSEESDRMEEYASDAISEIAAARAQRFLESVLKGNEDAGKQLLGAGASSRYRMGGVSAGEPWASLIHGNLFQTTTMKLREEIVKAHADLLKSERINDLESIVEGLTAQVRDLQKQLSESRNYF